MPPSSRLPAPRALAALACLAACGGAPRAPDHPASPPAAPPAPDAAAAAAAPASPDRAPDPDLNRPPPRRLLSIDWARTPLATDADALAAWEQIAPTGADWEEKLDEVPAEPARYLAVAMLRAGRFTCAPPPPPGDCATPAFVVPDPAPTAGLADPCLRRLLALWSLAQLEPEDLPAVQDALRAIAAIPPPESQLVDAALRVVPERDNAQLLPLIVIAAGAGQSDLVGAVSARLSEAELIEAATRHHVAVALEVLSAQAHRGAYLAAVADEDLAAAARVRAIGDLVADADAGGAPTLAPDLRAALAKGAASRDCGVAAAAARALELHGDRRFVPVRPRTRAPEVMTRALCVLASYEPLLRDGERSPLATYVPPRGLERVLIEYDALSDVDEDGDGDPHTKRAVDLIPRGEVSLPEPEAIARAMKRCAGATCRSADHEVQLGFRAIGGELWLSKLELAERPPCP